MIAIFLLFLSAEIDRKRVEEMLIICLVITSYFGSFWPFCQFNFFKLKALKILNTNVRRNDCRLFHSGISISKKERRRKLFHFNLVTTVYNCYDDYCEYCCNFVLQSALISLIVPVNGAKYT